jgi:Domain of unknown function (DUF4389)
MVTTYKQGIVMSDELDDFVDNIREPSFWARILLMIIFALASYVILLPLILVLSIAQALFTLITGQSNANLRYFSATLVLYVAQVIQYLTYLTDVKPYPFSDLPEVEDKSLEEKASSSKNSSANKPTNKSDKPAAKKAAAPKKVKKKAAKKKAVKKASKSVEKPAADADSASDS